ncbi:hypothetical protein MN116_002756, partial [Schistosoma mekongi]
VIRHWFREGLRFTVYLGVPFGMYFLCDMPYVQEFFHNRVRKTHFEKTGEDLGEYDARPVVKPID